MPTPKFDPILWYVNGIPFTYVGRRPLKDEGKVVVAKGGIVFLQVKESLKLLPLKVRVCSENLERTNREEGSLFTVKRECLKPLQILEVDTNLLDETPNSGKIEKT